MIEHTLQELETMGVLIDNHNYAQKLHFRTATNQKDKKRYCRLDKCYRRVVTVKEGWPYNFQMCDDLSLSEVERCDLIT